MNTIDDTNDSLSSAVLFRDSTDFYMAITIELLLLCLNGKKERERASVRE